MALTIVVTKKSVRKMQDKLFSITVNLSCLDGTTEVINQDFSEKYRSGQLIDEIVKRMIPKMQQVINDYKSEQQIYNHAKLDSAVVDIQASLVG